MVFNNNLLLGAAGAGAGYEIDQSIRFSDNDSARLARTVSSSGSLTTWTLSGWIKRGRYTSNVNNQWFPVYTASAGSTAYDAPLNFNDAPAGGSFDVYLAGQEWRTTALARDTSAWYHVVTVWDSTNGTASDRMRLYVNGERQTDFSITGSASSGLNSQWNSSSYSHHRIGNLNYNGGETTYVFDGYLAEINFIDGTALDPTSFGETNDDGVWIPKAYTGSYGTNGFYITGATDSDLGEDFSGNNNDFTSSGLTSADQRLDTPTLNKATLNPLSSGTNHTLSDGNLFVSTSGTSGFWHRTNATQSLTYKTYWEMEVGTYYALNFGLNSLGNSVSGQNAPAGLFGAGIQNNEAFVSGSYVNESSGGRTFPVATGNYIMFAYDPARNALWIGNEGTWKDGTASSASSATILAEIEGSGTSYAIFTGIGEEPIPYVSSYATNSATARFSSEDWEGIAPTGYEELSTAFIATPSIKDGSAHFQPTLYTGTGASNAVSQSGNSTFQPDLVWIKGRSGATEHVLTDAVRGVTKELSSNDTGAEETVAQGLTTFGTAGFTVGTDGSYNTSSATYVGWQWKANGAGSSNTDGTITSTASANTTAGFSIVKFVGNAISGATVGHGLGVAPKMLTVKDMSVGGSWAVYHAALGATKYMNLDTTAAAVAITNRWNDTEPTSSVFSLGNENEVNASGRSYVAYCFAEIPGYSSIGSYTGNGSATDGPFVYTGFKPKWIMYKSSSNAGTRWGILDTDRSASGGGNSVGDQLFAELTNAEANADHEIDFLSNGFKVRDGSVSVNGNGYTITYMAFAENPFGGDGVAPATAR